MKRKILALCLCFLPLFVSVAEAAPSVSAPCAVLIDGKTGLVLYEKNAHETAYPASTTKVMTAILALERSRMEDMVEVSFEAVNSISYDSSKAGLFAGEVFSMKDLVYSLLICSANDAANVIAEHVAGDIDAFVELMNTRAAELGAKNTHFENTHGLHDANHYTTAYDLAVLTKHALTLPHFREIVATRAYQLAPTDKYEEIRYINSTNHLLNPQHQYYYPEAIGVKTGYTSDAGSCLIAASETEGATYVAVVLGAENEDGQVMSFVDSRTLLSYGKEHFKPVTLSEAGTVAEGIPIKKAKKTKLAGVHTEETVKAILPEGVEVSAVEKREYIKTNLEAPVKAGDVLGRVEYVLGETIVGKTYLVADTDIEKKSLLGRLFSWLFSQFWTYPVLLLALFVFLARRTRKMRAKRRRIRQAEIRRRNKYQ